MLSKIESSDFMQNGKSNFTQNGKLDFTHFYPAVYQAVAGKNYMIYAYMNDGGIRAVDMKPIIKKGGVFAPLQDEKIFREKLTVINHTAAWDLDGTRDESTCLDIDPFMIFNSSKIAEIPQDELEIIAK